MNVLELITDDTTVALLVLGLLATPIVAIFIAARQSRRERREEEELGSGL